MEIECLRFMSYFALVRHSGGFRCPSWAILTLWVQVSFLGSLYSISVGRPICFLTACGNADSFCHLRFTPFLA